MISNYRARFVRWLIGISKIVFMLVLSSGFAGASPFSAGTTRVSLIAGSGSAFNDNYIVLGAGIGHYYVDGLEISLEGEAWLSGEPGIYKLSPAVRYVIDTGAQWHPYVGAFYRRTFIDGPDDINSVGGRAGVYMTQGRSALLGVGLVYDYWLDCDTDIYRSCSNTYPELMASFVF